MADRLTKTDCFGYVPEDPSRARHREEHCTALTEVYCSYCECGFYKPTSEVDKQKIIQDIRRYQSRSKKLVED